jgi:hypothetical protein
MVWGDCRRPCDVPQVLKGHVRHDVRVVRDAPCSDGRRQGGSKCRIPHARLSIPVSKTGQEAWGGKKFTTAVAARWQQVHDCPNFNDCQGSLHTTHAAAAAGTCRRANVRVQLDDVVGVGQVPRRQRCHGRTLHAHSHTHTHDAVVTHCKKAPHAYQAKQHPNCSLPFQTKTTGQPRTSECPVIARPALVSMPDSAVKICGTTGRESSHGVTKCSD